MAIETLGQVLMRRKVFDVDTCTYENHDEHQDAANYSVTQELTISHHESNLYFLGSQP